MLHYFVFFFCPSSEVCVGARRPLLAIVSAVEEEPLGPQSTVETQTSMIQVGQEVTEETNTTACV